MIDEKKGFRLTPLLFTTLIISICSMIYELLIGSLSSYLLGDSITQFSLTIGLYLFAMGLGSYFSKYIIKSLFNKFIFIEILVGLLGGFSTLALYYSYVFSNLYNLVMYFFIISIGFLVGIEIPLLVRIIEENNKSLKDGIANLFAFDYLGGLIGSIVFPIILLPKLGYISVAFLAALFNLVAAFILINTYEKNINNPKIFKLLTLSIGLIMLVMIFFGDKMITNFEDGLYRDKVIYSKQSHYQKIVLTKHKDDLRLFLNGNIQFSTSDEYRYHESIVHVPMSLVDDAKNILLLGAGDGLAAKELLKYDSVEKITIVDLDEEVVELCKTNPIIKKINNNSLANEKVKIVNEDAFVFAHDSNEIFDLIIIDLPDPDDETLSKLYSTYFYKIVKNILSTDGLIVTQSSSPYYTGNAFWCITKTMQEEFNTVIPYHLYIPSFGDWGFNIGSNKNISVENIKIDEDIETSYLNNNNIKGLFLFSKDETKNIDEINPNTLIKPVISNYYKKDIMNW